MEAMHKIEFHEGKDIKIWFYFGIGFYLFFTLCGILSGYFIRNSFVIPIIWGAFGVYGTYYVALSPHKIILDENEIRYESVYGIVKKLSNKEITFTEKYERLEDRSSIFPPNERREQRLVLYLHFPKYRVKIYQNYTPQYDEVLAYCKRNCKKVYEPENKNIYFMPFWFMIGFLIVHLIFISYCKSQKLEGKVRITATYRSHHLGRRGKNSSWYELGIYLKEHPKLKFGSWSIDSEDKSKVDSILRSKPHIFVFTISRDDYEKKIKKSVPMEFCDNYIDRNFVEVLDKLEHIENENGEKIFNLKD